MITTSGDTSQREYREGLCPYFCAQGELEGGGNANMAVEWKHHHVCLHLLLLIELYVLSILL